MAVRRVIRSLSRGRERTEHQPADATSPSSTTHHHRGILGSARWRSQPPGERESAEPFSVTTPEARVPRSVFQLPESGDPPPPSADLWGSAQTKPETPRNPETGRSRSLQDASGPSLMGRQAPRFKCDATDHHGRVVIHFNTESPTGKFTLLCLFSGGDDWPRCQSKMFKMEELWRGYGRQDDCQFIGISKRQTAEELRAFRLGLGATLTMPMAPDPQGHIFGLFGNYRLPQFYLLDSSYIVVQQSIGFLSHELLTQICLQYQEASEYECNIKGIKAEETMKAAGKTAFPQPLH